jgi:hypothetical protein
VNPNPHFLGDITLNYDKIRLFFEGPIFKTPAVFEVGPTLVYSSFDQLGTGATMNQTADCYLTTMLHLYNNPSVKTTITVGEYPAIMQRDEIVRRMTLPELKSLFKIYRDEFPKVNPYFDIRLQRPDIFLEPKMKYITEVIRQTLVANKNVLLIYDNNMADLIEQSWENLEWDPEKDKKRVYLSDLTSRIKAGSDEMNFVDYIEKHVILDIILGPIMKKFFVDLKSFPFKAEDVIGANYGVKNVFILWKHFHDNYVELLKQKLPAEDPVKSSDEGD